LIELPKLRFQSACAIESIQSRPVFLGVTRLEPLIYGVGTVAEASFEKALSFPLESTAVTT